MSIIPAQLFVPHGAWKDPGGNSIEKKWLENSLEKWLENPLEIPLD